MFPLACGGNPTDLPPESSFARPPDRARGKDPSATAVCDKGVPKECSEQAHTALEEGEIVVGTARGMGKFCPSSAYDAHPSGGCLGVAPYREKQTQSPAPEGSSGLFSLPLPGTRPAYSGNYSFMCTKPEVSDTGKKVCTGTGGTGIHIEPNLSKCPVPVLLLSLIHI